MERTAPGIGATRFRSALTFEEQSSIPTSQHTTSSPGPTYWWRHGQSSCSQAQVFACGRVGLALACAAFVLYLTSSGGTATAAPASKTSQANARVADGSDHYSLLKGADGDGIAGWHVAQTPRSEALLGLDLSRARVIHQDQAKTVAAVASKGKPCLLVRQPDGRAAVGCGVAPGQPTALVSYTGAIGLAPDSTESVTYTMTDGSIVTGRVVDNVWKSPPEAANVHLVVDGQTRDLELMPQSSLPAVARIVDGAVVQDNAPQGG